MEIEDSAHKHSIPDEDMIHAVENAMFVHFFDDYRMLVGPARNGALLEIGVNLRQQIFHAMKARPKFLRR
ncbi:MAG: hypothetical protein E7L06_08345 [Schaalia turicensis]|nr:hypothetical protein [Schaalia turicensis]